MNTYGKPINKWHSYFKLIHEVREETGHIYDIIHPHDGLEEIYQDSKTRDEFKKRMIEKYDWDKRSAILKVNSEFLKTTKYFKVTELEYCKQKIEMVDAGERVISEFPLTWNGITYEETIQRIKDMAHSMRGEFEEIRNSHKQGVSLEDL